MLTRNVRVEGFTAEDWARLQRVLGGGAPRTRAGWAAHDENPRAADGAGPDPDGPAFGIVAVTSGARLTQLLSTRAGRLDVMAEPWPVPLEALARRHGASWAVELERGVPEELFDRLGARVTPEMEYLGQVLVALDVLTELEAERKLRCWPWRLGAFRVPGEALVRRLLDAVCPQGHAVLLGAFEHGQLATAVVARRATTGFDWLLGPEPLRQEMGLVSGDWTRDYHRLARAAERRVAPLALGCFAEAETLARLTSGRADPGALALAVAARDVIVSPLAPALAVPLGLDVGRAAIARLGDLAGRLGVTALFRPGGALRPVLNHLRPPGRVEPSLITQLGFEPLALVRLLLMPGWREA